MVRYTVGSEESATILGDEYIILDTDASEVFVGLNLIEVEELGTMTWSLPVIDESRNEVNTWLICYYEA